MKRLIALATVSLVLSFQAAAQEIDCDITFTNLQTLQSESRENLNDFLPQLKQYVNSYRWTKVDIGNAKIKCAFNISLQTAPTTNHYTTQVFIGSQRPIFKEGRNTAELRIIDNQWEFDYTRNQSLIHQDNHFDPLLSFVDFYINLIIGYDFDSYKAGDGTPYFQKAMDIANLARGSGAAGRGWDLAPQGNFSRAQLVDELLNPKFQDFREAVFRYHYRGLDERHKDTTRARKNILGALERIAKVRDKINTPSLVIRTFFDTKYQEIAEVFEGDPDATVFEKLIKIDPSHEQAYLKASQGGK